VKRPVVLLLALLMALAVTAPLVAYTPGAPPGVVLAADLVSLEMPAATFLKIEAVGASLESGAILFVTDAPSDYVIAAKADMLAGLMRGFALNLDNHNASIAQDYSSRTSLESAMALEWV
jgi:hypothetical protein